MDLRLDRYLIIQVKYLCYTIYNLNSIRERISMANIQDKDSRNNGRWTKTQHEKFLLGLQLYGKNWKKIQQLIGSRTGAQIRSHAQKFFLKSKPDFPLHQQVQLDSSNPLELNLSVISKQINQTPSNQQHQQKQKQFSSQKQQFYFQQQFSLQFLTQSSYYMQEIIKIEIANRNKKQREFSFWELIDFGGKSQQKQGKTDNMKERQAEKEKQKQNRDIQASEDNMANIQENRRKDSFVVFDHCNDSRQETAFPHLSMLGEPIV